MDVFCFELSKLFVNSGATDIVLETLSSTAVETAIAQCTSRWAMARGHRLNTFTVLAAVHGLSGLFRAVSAVEASLCRPLPILSPSLTGHLASVDVKQHESSSRSLSIQRQAVVCRGHFMRSCEERNSSVGRASDRKGRSEEHSPLRQRSFLPAVNTSPLKTL